MTPRCEQCGVRCFPGDRLCKECKKGPPLRAVESNDGEYRSDCCGAAGACSSAFVDSGICPKCHEHCTFVKDGHS